jgi:hypothetical protein
VVCTVTDSALSFRVIVAVALLASSACVHHTVINSSPAGAEVYLDDEAAPAGQTPFTLSDPSRKVRVVADERELAFTLQRNTHWGYAIANTSLACVASAGALACIGGGVWALGSLIGFSMPVIGPIIAVLGAPPAVCGTLFWSGVFGAGCAALTLPVQVFSSSSIGPDQVTVDLERGSVSTDPPGQFRLVEEEEAAGDGPPASPAPAAPPPSQSSSAPAPSSMPASLEPGERDPEYVF